MAQRTSWHGRNSKGKELAFRVRFIGGAIGTARTIWGVVLCFKSEGRFEGMATREAVEALGECQSRDGDSGTWREAAPDAAEDGQLGLEGVASRQR